MRSDERWSDAVVDAACELSPTVRGFSLRPAGGVRPWSVGSHIRIKVSLRDGRTDVRHYSLVGLPQDSRASGCYRIAVKRAEPGRGGSRHIWSLTEGEPVEIAGPDNHFDLPVSSRPTLLVAGGIGITPIVGMALTLAARGVPLAMHYAARDADELIYADRLADALGARLKLYTDAAGERIDLDAEIAALPAVSAGAGAGRMLICGPVPLLQAAQDAWRRAGRAAADLRFETFGSSGNRAAEPFWVDVPRHGLRLQVPADRSLLDVLAEHGVDVLHDCRRGECGLCAVDIRAVDGEVDHRDVFFSAAEQRSNARLCACVSRVVGGGLVLDSSFRPDDAVAA